MLLTWKQFTSWQHVFTDHSLVLVAMVTVVYYSGIVVMVKSETCPGNKIVPVCVDR